MIPYILAIVAVAIASVSQIVLKSSAIKKHKTVIYEYINIRVLGAYTMLIFSVIINIYALSAGLQIKELSIIEGLGYLLVPLFSFWAFRETINIKQISSAILIVIGIIIFFM